MQNFGQNFKMQIFCILPRVSEFDTEFPKNLKMFMFLSVLTNIYNLFLLFSLFVNPPIFGIYGSMYDPIIIVSILPPLNVNDKLFSFIWRSF
jgi:hypothetical protein